MGMLSDFLTLIKGTETNIEGVVTGYHGKLKATDIGGTSNDGLVTNKKLADDLDAKIITEIVGPYEGDKPATTGVSRFSAQAVLLSKNGYKLIGYALVGTTNADKIIYSSYGNFDTSLVSVQMYAADNAASTWKFSVEAIYKKI